MIGGGGPPSLPIMSWRDMIAAAENPYFPPHHVPPFPDPSPIEIWLQETTPTYSNTDRTLPLAQPMEGMLDTGGLYPGALVQVRWDKTQGILVNGSVSLKLQTASLPQEPYFVDVAILATIDSSHSATAGDVISAWIGLGTATRLARYVRWILVGSTSPAPDPWALRFSILMHLQPRV
jgi:hypothetical protein